MCEDVSDEDPWCCCERRNDVGGGGCERATAGGRDVGTTEEMGGRDRFGSADGGQGPLLDPGRVPDGISGTLKLKGVEGTRKDWPGLCWSCWW